MCMCLSILFTRSNSISMPLAASWYRLPSLLRLGYVRFLNLCCALDLLHNFLLHSSSYSPLLRSCMYLQNSTGRDSRETVQERRGRKEKERRWLRATVVTWPRPRLQLLCMRSFCVPWALLPDPVTPLRTQLQKRGRKVRTVWRMKRAMNQLPSQGNRFCNRGPSRVDEEWNDEH